MSDSYDLRVFGMKYRLFIMQLAMLLFVMSFMEQFIPLWGFCRDFFGALGFRVLFRVLLLKGTEIQFTWFMEL